MEFFESSKFFERNNLAFEDLRAEILERIPDARVEHVGASAIKGLASKGDLDVFVGVDPSHFDETLAKLVDLGCSEKMGTLRTDSLCMLVVDRYSWDVAIQLVANGSKFEFFVRFRDELKRSPLLVEKYNKLKEECVDMSSDEYRYLKSKFIESVV